MGIMLVAVVACNRVNGAESPRDAAREVSSSWPGAGTYVLDPEHSFIHFAAQHLIVGTVRGRFNTMAGTAIAGTDPRLSQVDVVIEAASLDTQNDARDAHLRSPDFFDVTAFPTIRFHGTSLRKAGDRWAIDGSLMIRGIAREVPLEVAFMGTAPAQTGTPSRVAFQAAAAVRRADFAMTHGLLDEIGAVSARPDVWIQIDAEFLATEPSVISQRLTSIERK
jgi:polyisoprenoid-binding protein YceI